jgi:hypothetical protein
VLRIRLFISDPDFYPSRIPDPKQQQVKGVKKNLFFCNHKFHKIKNYFIFEMPKKKIWANFQRIIELFTPQIVTKLSKYGFGIRDPEKPIPDPGSQLQLSKRHRIPDPDLQN